MTDLQKQAKEAAHNVEVTAAFHPKLEEALICASKLLRMIERGELREVVYCGECELYETEDCRLVGNCDGCDCPVDMSFNETGFCSYGRRKSDG